MVIDSSSHYEIELKQNVSRSQSPDPRVTEPAYYCTIQFHRHCENISFAKSIEVLEQKYKWGVIAKIDFLASTRGERIPREREKKGTDGIFQFWGEKRLTTPFVQKIGKFFLPKRGFANAVGQK